MLSPSVSTSMNQTSSPHGALPRLGPMGRRQRAGSRGGCVAGISACNSSRERQLAPSASRRCVLIAAALALNSTFPCSSRALTDGMADGTPPSTPTVGPERMSAIGSKASQPNGGLDQAQTQEATSTSEAGIEGNERTPFSAAPLDSSQLKEEAQKRLLEEQEERNRRGTRKGRIRELEKIRAELAEKEIVLLEKEKELLEKDQTLLVLREELELERKLRALLTYEKEKAEEEAALAMGLCSGANLLP